MLVKKILTNRSFLLTIAIIVFIGVSISLIYVMLAEQAIRHGWQQALGNVFFVLGLMGGIIFVLVRILMALVTRKAIQRKEADSIRRVLWETVACFACGVVCFCVGWTTKDEIGFEVLHKLYYLGFGGIIIGADSLRRISQSRITRQIALFFAFFIAINLIIGPIDAETKTTSLLMFLFVLTYILYYLPFGIVALKEPSKRTRGSEIVKKLTAGVFCYWFLWALPVYKSRFYGSLYWGEISVSVVAILVFILVLFCLGNRELTHLSKKEIAYVLLTILGILLSLSPGFFVMSQIIV